MVDDDSLGRGLSRRTAGVRTGGRSERVVKAVLEAALSELARVGYAGLRHEDVAARAQVAKTTIYRRWPTKVELVEAAIQEFSAYDEPLPDTGSLREDLRIVLEAAMKKLSTPGGQAIARMVVIDRADPKVDELCRDLKDRSRKHRSEVVVRAQQRGELPKEVDAVLVVDCIFGLVMGRLMRFGEKVDRATCERLIDLVVTGAEHGGGQPKPRSPL